MDKELKVFSDFLKHKKLKFTRQRVEILRSFLNTDRHLSVEELYYIVKKRNSAIGQATVFRTLKLLAEAGIADEVDLGDKKVRYEHKYGHTHHDHLVCIQCGRFIEVVEPRIEKLQDSLCKKFEFSLQKHKLDIYGICRECRLKKKHKLAAGYNN